VVKLKRPVNELLGSSIEQTTLEDKNNLKPGVYRLACMVKPKGPVVVEIMEPT
jgi:hypothetical protein